MDELQIRKIVYGLLQAGLVEMIRPARPAAAGTPASRATESAEEMPATAPQMRRPAVKRGIIQKLIRRIREL